VEIVTVPTNPDQPSVRSNSVDSHSDRTNEIDRLATLSSIEYDRVRRDKAQELGLRVVTLDKQVADARVTAHRDENSPSFLSDIEPWPKKVLGRNLLDNIKSIVERYLVLPSGASEVISMWILHTYCFESFDLSPILMFSSPTKQCGKTTAMKLLSALVHRPLPASNVSTAAIYRAIELWHPTLLLDEADAYVAGNETMRGILNSGHSRRFAYVIRCEGEERVPTSFSVWTPKALAAIGTLQSTIMDRSIVVDMKRKKAEDAVGRLEEAFLESTQIVTVKRMCSRWSADHSVAVRECAPTLAHNMNDRVADNWTAMAKIAEIAGWREQFDRALRAMAFSDRDEDIGLTLLADVRDLFDYSRQPHLPSYKIVASLNAREDRPWSRYCDGQPITKFQLAALLRPFKIRPRTIRVGSDTPKGYTRKSFEDAWERYLVPSRPFGGATSQQCNGADDSGGDLGATSTRCVSAKNTVEPFHEEACGDVADY